MATVPSSLLRSDVKFPPRLLVSVQSAAEASDAIAGGADIVDIKDPSRGSLGFAGAETIAQIDGGGRLVTAALGECREWGLETPVVPRNVSMMKLGLAGLASSRDWIQEWLDLRRRIEAARPRAWVAVAYVDSELADSPEVDSVAAAAVATGCAGLLLDTFDKRAGQLTEFVSDRQLEMLAEQLHGSGLFLAAAGRLTIESVARLAALPVDIVAVRSAACAAGDRRGRIAQDRVAACRKALGKEPVSVAC